MAGLSKAFYLIPLIGIPAAGFYYTDYFQFPVFTPNLLSNSELLSDLERSKDVGYSTQLVGYEDKSNRTFENWRRFDKRMYGNYYYGYPTRKTVALDSAKEIIGIINDYSVKVETPCGHGTGWILDYVVPKAGERYPRTWFIATNAHVVEGIKFGSNPYRQPLPRKGMGGCEWKKWGNTPVALLKEDLTGIKQYWDIDYRSLRKDRNWVSLWVDKDPRLFYVPINYLGTNNKAVGHDLNRSNYYKDFAVLEFTIDDEDIARKITNNFYDKYDLTTGREKYKALNLFADEILSKNNNDTLTQGGRNNMFISGYASNGFQDITLSNFDLTKNTASSLSFLPYVDRDKYQMKNKAGQLVIGHVDIGKMDDRDMAGSTVVNWGGVQHTNWGYNYLLDNVHLASGASGSLTTDINGNVLGLYRMHDGVHNLGFVEPIRSKGIYRRGKILYPKYDLIEGAKGQIHSFRSQLKRYYLNKGRTTNLSRYRGW